MTRCMLLGLSYLSFTSASVPSRERTREKVQDLHGSRHRWGRRRVPGVAGEGPAGWWHSFLTSAGLVEPPLAPPQKRQRVWCCCIWAMEHWIIQALHRARLYPLWALPPSPGSFLCPAGMGTLLGTGGGVERSPFAEESASHPICCRYPKAFFFFF